MNRKFWIIFAALLIAASLCACTGGGDEETTSGNTIIIGTEDTTSSNVEQNETTESDANQTTDEITTEPEEALAGELTYIEQKDTIYIYNRNGALNIRDGEEKIVVSVPNGTELQRIAVSEDGVWSKVIYEDAECYVVSNSVVNFDINEGFVEVNKTLTLKGSLKVRIVPFFNELLTSDNQVAGYLAPDDTVEIIAENTEIGWYKIKYESDYTGDCFIKANPDYFVEETTEADSETTEAESESSSETN